MGDLGALPQGNDHIELILSDNSLPIHLQELLQDFKNLLPGNLFRGVNAHCPLDPGINHIGVPQFLHDRLNDSINGNAVKPKPQTTGSGARLPDRGLG